MEKRAFSSWVGAVICISLVMVACDQIRTQTPLPQANDTNEIFSNRPQTISHTLVLVKLKTPPLLTTTLVEDGKRSVDPDQLEDLNAEQKRFENELLKLSPDIKIVYTYKLVLNAFAVEAPVKMVDKIRRLVGVISVENSESFAAPAPRLRSEKQSRVGDLKERNSVKFIGAHVAHARNLRGQNMRVGVIDSGVDYTHAMFGGAGTAEAFSAINPAGDPIGFPNGKIVGGIDLVGSEFDPNSPERGKRLPVPDDNPIDENGHGTHVAGTIAGQGDGVNTYDGVAPDALLYAIKVFGKGGGTSDAAVIAGLEYAADPNGDMDLADQMDVVNLSLGSGYGDPHILYAEAIQNISNAGTVVVCAAGNEGDESYIVNAPGIAEGALSVASSIDDSDHNWRFRAVKFSTPMKPEIYVEVVEGEIGQPIAESGDVQGALVYVGLANTDFSDEVKASLKGKVALIDRGAVPFVEKIERAVNAGAIGVVVINNDLSRPIVMGGGDKKFDIPTIMIGFLTGMELREVLRNSQEATVQFKTDRVIELEGIVDSISGFSSKGPRSIDALIKPEIAAPGTQIISAAMGSGHKGAALDGTSMASPHMAGVMAIMKQRHPELSPSELKSLLMGSAKPLSHIKTGVYPVSRQGAGRVQLATALDSVLISYPSAVSLGALALEENKTVGMSLRLRSLSKKEDMTLRVSFESSKPQNIRMVAPAQVTVQADASASLNLRFTLNSMGLKGSSSELDGYVLFSKANGTVVMRVPVLAVTSKVSKLNVAKLSVRSTSEADSQEAVVDAEIRNSGLHTGSAYLFNLLHTDGRKSNPDQDPFRSRACDLAAAGYRVISKFGVETLQFAAKIYEPLTTWDRCHISILIDADADGEPDQELVGMSGGFLEGLMNSSFASILIDSKKAREIRKNYEQDAYAGKDTKENYLPAVEDFQPISLFDHSTIAIVEAPLSKVKVHPDGSLFIRVASTYNESNALEPDDFLIKGEKWMAISVAKRGAGYVDLPEVVELAPGKSQIVSFTKGAGAEPLWALFPQNKPVRGGLNADDQAQIVKPVYEIE